MPRIQTLTLVHSPVGIREVADLPESARLVVLLGPNGSGKSSILQGIKEAWRGQSGYSLRCHGGSTKPPIYWRGAYRRPVKSAVERNHLANRLLYSRQEIGERGLPPTAYALDERVAENYQRLYTLVTLRCYDTRDTWIEANETLLLPINQRLARLFNGLKIDNLRNHTQPVQSMEDLNLQFIFSRGGNQFSLESLSAGEAEVFDLLLDLEISHQDYPDAVYCIDEPELHLHTALQPSVLGELMDFISGPNQLWIATHSIGMIHKALKLHAINPTEVVFLDLDSRVNEPLRSIRPAMVDRNLWKKAFSVALHDLADLVSPRTIVICEGRMRGAPNPERSEFDARVY